MIPLFYGKIENGKLELFKPDLFKMYYQSMEGLVGLTIRKKGKIRSNPQNNTYWMWCTEIGDDLGYAPEEMHNYFKSEFLKEVKMIQSKSGIIKEVTMIQSTTKQTTITMKQFMDKIWRFAGEMGIILTDPDDFNNLK